MNRSWIWFHLKFFFKKKSLYQISHYDCQVDFELSKHWVYFAHCTCLLLLWDPIKCCAIKFQANVTLLAQLPYFIFIQHMGLRSYQMNCKIYMHKHDRNYLSNISHHSLMYVSCTFFLNYILQDNMINKTLKSELMQSTHPGKSIVGLTL